MKYARGTTTILAITARYLLPLLALLAIFFFLRGHDRPGGGFAAALLAATAVAAYALGDTPACVRRLVRLEPTSIIGAGLGVALLAGLLPMAWGNVFLEAAWAPGELPVMEGIKVGTPLLFDLGVFVLSGGAVLAVLIALLEDE